jgi:hypothetical protein
MLASLWIVHRPRVIRAPAQFRLPPFQGLDARRRLRVHRVGTVTPAQLPQFGLHLILRRSDYRLV